jgi:hypothetical protein
MRKLLIFVLFILAIVLPNAVYAQDQPQLATVQVRIWPEYDRPAALVIYDLTLPAGTSLPTTVVMKIPVSAGEPYAVASRQSDGSLVNVPYDPLVTNGEWSEVSFTATTPEARLEYYDPAITVDGALHSYEYRWAGNYAVESFQIEVQQPLGTTDFSSSPSLGNGTTGTDGMVYYRSDIGSLPYGQDLQIQLQYQKPASGLSADSLPIEPAAPIDENSSATRVLFDYLPQLLFLVGLVLLAGGAYWYWVSGRKHPKREERRRRKVKTQAPQAVPTGDEAVHCHQCGKRANPGDLFCRTCGTQLRK